MKKNKFYILGWRTAAAMRALYKDACETNAAVTLWEGYDADEAKKAFDAADFDDGIYFIELWEETTVNTRHDYKMKEGGAT